MEQLRYVLITTDGEVMSGAFSGIDKSIKIQSMIVTNIREVYLRHKLKAYLFELRDYVKTSSKQLEKVKSNEKVYLETFIITEEISNNLMKKVGRTVRRCIMADIDVEDELALACYDWYKKQFE